MSDIKFSLLLNDVHMIIPPYLYSYLAVLTVVSHIRHWTFSVARKQKFSIMWLKEAYRVLKPGRHIYVFIDWRMYSLIFHLMKHVGFQIRNCIVWDKVNMGMGWQYRYRHEFIIFAVKGKSKVRRIGSRAATDILRVPRISGNKTIHPTEKPTDVIKPLVLNSSLEGEHIVDFFCGSGPVKEVADETGRLFTGFEIDPEHYSNAIKR
ncbi:DNA-methyltransferase [Fontibacillus panacisegetis]|nr:site-specific DNA-methyltransferase [Fontibacillus solani]